MRYLLYFIMILLTVELVFSQQSNRKAVNVTVYNDNFGVVRDERVIDIQKGISTIKISDVAKGIDATSVHIKLDGTVLEQNYQYDLANLYRILERYIDREISIVDGNGGIIHGQLISISADQIVLKKEDGGLIMLPKIDKYQLNVEALPEGLITVPTLVWKVASKKSGKQDVEITYETQGLSWHAEYIAVLNKDDSKMDFNSWVSVDNKSGATYKDANLKLVAGNVHRAEDEYRPYPVMTKRMNLEAEESAGFEEKAFFEYHIYNLQRPTTISDNETKQISLFESSGVKIKKKYNFLINGYESNIKKQNASVVIEFVNTKENGLGMPMPKGKVRLYKSDGNNVEFIGEDRIGHTAKKENIKLKVGDAFDVFATGRVVSKKRISDKVYEYECEFKITNRKDEDIVVDVDNSLWGNWEILYSSYKYEKQNANTVRYKIPVSSDSESVLTYKLRLVY